MVMATMMRVVAVLMGAVGMRTVLARAARGNDKTELEQF
jgi:hypothetical protein